MKNSGKLYARGLIYGLVSKALSDSSPWPDKSY